MTVRGKYIASHDGQEIFVRFWDQVEKPVGIIQIIHGMAEHSGRYDEFAHYLNQAGFIVCADDHRGHGESVEEEVFGYVGENGFNNIVQDEKYITDLLKEMHDGLPIFIFAHSFGSFIGQEYMIRFSHEIDGVILSGSAKQDGLDVKVGRIVANIQNRLFDNKKEAKLIDKLSFGSYNKKIENQETKFDWLTRDAEVVEEYIKDEFCNFISPINFYYELFNAFHSLYLPDRLQDISKELPLLIVSGDMDPVGHYGRAVEALFQLYEDLEIKNVELKLFPGGRHELVNETNKNEVFSYLVNWLQQQYFS